MPTRRAFLASLAAGAGLPSLTWADAGSPAFVAAAKEPGGSFALFGLTDGGARTFRIALPARGHAAAAHPVRPEAVAFARRPGTYALVIDCVGGAVIGQLSAPDGHHFSGHGAFSSDGSVLYTAEIRRADGAGRIGLWDRRADYRRIGAFGSGGTGPHEILRLPGSDVLAVANGGIVTSPEDGRTKLNIDVMRPNLSYLSPEGQILDRIELDADLHMNSVRHLAAHPDGTVAFAMQWQGAGAEVPPLLGLHRRGAAPVLCDAPGPLTTRLKGYAGSVAVSAGAGQAAITCPRGGQVVLFDMAGAFAGALGRVDVCGIGARAGGFLATDGMGGVSAANAAGLRPLQAHDLAWDNHLVAL